MVPLQVSTALRQANMVALHQASTEVPHRVSTEVHQDKVNMAHRHHKVNTVHLLQAKDSTEHRRQVSMANARRRVAPVDIQASSSTANRHQAGGTSIKPLTVAPVA